MKMNIRNGKYFDRCELSYHFHVIEYQYRGLPHAHLVARFEGAYDIDDPNRANMLEFVNKHFIAEMPRFEGEDYQNIFALDGAPDFTDLFKRKAVEMVRRITLTSVQWPIMVANGKLRMNADVVTVVLILFQTHM